MSIRCATVLALAAALVGGCQGSARAPTASQAVPVLQYRTNPENVPGYRSSCAGGQPNADYNCPEDRN